MTTDTFRLDMSASVAGLHGWPNIEVRASERALVAAFGTGDTSNPTGKVAVEWRFRRDDGAVAALHDWKGSGRLRLWQIAAADYDTARALRAWAESRVSEAEQAIRDADKSAARERAQAWRDAKQAAQHAAVSDRELAGACWTLTSIRAPALKLPRTVSRHIAVLEQRGLVTHDDSGWRLTDAGRDLARTLP